MNLSDPIGDMFTRIRNGQLRSLSFVKIPASKFRLKILEVLKAEGYIKNILVEDEKNKRNLKVDLKYYEGTPVIKEIKRYLNLEEGFTLGLQVYLEFKMV